MNRTDRLYAIVEELRAPGPRGRTAEQLAARFEVSTRTIKRDVSALQQAGAPVWATAGPGGGYAIDVGAALPPLTFSAGEATAIATALASQPGLPFGPEGQSALTKVLGAMPARRRADVSDLSARVWVRPDAPPRTGVAKVLDEAVRKRVVVNIDYRDGEGRSTARRPVEPMAFAFEQGRWYLLGWCRRRRAGRWFRLDRVTGARLTAEPIRDRDLGAVFGDPPSDATPVSLLP